MGSKNKKRKFSEIDFVPSKDKISNLKDLIKTILEWKKSNNKTNKVYKKLADALPHLRELDRMVGMEQIKKDIVKQIIYFAQGLNQGEMMNIVITGNPGVGKSSLCEILAKIYSKLGIVSHGHYRIASRKDFVAGYMGQTTGKTAEFLESCIGGIVFIDEAYMIGTESDTEDYAKECVNVLNHFLSDNKRNVICILAGYKDEIENKVFSLNRGLPRRFPWRFHIDDYTGIELANIFIDMLVKVNKWKKDFEKDDIYNFFIQNEGLFKNNGGDCEKLLSLCKIIHSDRIFLNHNSQKKVLTLDDFNKGTEAFVNSLEEEEPEQEPELMEIVGDAIKQFIVSFMKEDKDEKTDYKNLMYI